MRQRKTVIGGLIKDAGCARGCLYLRTLIAASVLLTAPQLTGAASAQVATELIPEAVSLPAGKFFMGDISGGWDDDERPIFQRSLDSFAISRFEVTYDQFKLFADATNRNLEPLGDGDAGDRPITGVSWRAAKAYARWLSGHTGQKWRLPTEAEWEYAARANKRSLFQSGNNETDLCSVGNIADTSATAAGSNWEVTDCEDGYAGLAPVGKFPPNPLGLYDLHGNVWEWVGDCYSTYRRSGPAFRSPGNCESRVIRGGSYRTPGSSARFSNRDFLAEGERRPDVGFRLVREP